MNKRNSKNIYNYQFIFTDLVIDIVYWLIKKLVIKLAIDSEL